MRRTQSQRRCILSFVQSSLLTRTLRILSASRLRSLDPTSGFPVWRSRVWRFCSTNSGQTPQNMERSPRQMGKSRSDGARRTRHRHSPGRRRVRRYSHSRDSLGATRWENVPRLEARGTRHPAIPATRAFDGMNWRSVLPCPLELRSGPRLIRCKNVQNPLDCSCVK
jgi:hypothetical protein